MQHYTNTFYDDWFQYQDFIPDSDVYELYSLDRALRTDLLEQLHRACDLISKKSKNIYLLLSGGSDSEIIARNLCDLNISFTAMIMQYPNNANCIDVDNAIAICKELNIQYIVEEFDPQHIIDFPTEYRKKYPCVIATAEIVYLEFRNRYPKDFIFVRGEGEPRLSKIMDSWYVCFSKNTFHYFVDVVKKLYPNDVPFFYMYTKELYESYLNDTKLDNILKVADITSIANKKHIIFNNCGMNLEHKKKLTGFENYTKPNVPINNFELSTYYVNLRNLL